MVGRWWHKIMSWLSCLLMVPMVCYCRVRDAFQVGNSIWLMPIRVLPSRMMPSRMSCDNGDLDQSRDHGLHGRPRMVQKAGWQVGKACFGLFTRLIRVFPDRQTAIVSRHSRYPILIVVQATSGNLWNDQHRRALIDVWLGCGRETQRGTVIGSAIVFLTIQIIHRL